MFLDLIVLACAAYAAAVCLAYTGITEWLVLKLAPKQTDRWYQLSHVIPTLPKEAGHERGQMISERSAITRKPQGVRLLAMKFLSCWFCLQFWIAVGIGAAMTHSAIAALAVFTGTLLLRKYVPDALPEKKPCPSGKCGQSNNGMQERRGVATNPILTTPKGGE